MNGQAFLQKQNSMNGNKCKFKVIRGQVIKMTTNKYQQATVEVKVEALL